MCGTISRKLRNKTGRETQLRFYEVMAAPVVMCGSEIWALNEADRGSNDKTKNEISIWVLTYPLRS
jgi:hypothetical protein